MNWWIADLYHRGEIAMLVSWIFWVIFSITLHELAHGWTAMWQGDTTPRDTGHLSLNPLVHMGPWSLLAFALLGIAWGLMPVNPARFRDGRRGRLYVSGAGPAMNVVLFVLSATGLGLWLAFGPTGTAVAQNVEVFFWAGGTLNLVLAVFNMLPIPPLDGSNVLASLSFRMYNLMNNPQFVMFGMFIVLALMFAGAFSILFGLSRFATEQWGELVARILS
jgi:Zn-dependent protease